LAHSIGHTAPAGGGVTAAHIMGVFEKLGVAAEVTPKVKRTKRKIPRDGHTPGDLPTA
jgi:hypothetical protein